MTNPPPPPPPGQSGQPNWGQQPPQWNPGPPPPPARKSRKWLWIALAAVLVIIIISVAVGGGESDEKSDSTASTSTTVTTNPTAGGEATQAAPAAPPATTTKKKDGKTVVYEVSGDAGSATSITFFTTGSNQSQDNGASLPWSKEITVDDGDFTFLGVTAQSGGDGEITCKVTVDGKVEAENTSNGAYAVVMCNVDPF
ncbi:MAG: hypothetical protein DI630_27010 [Gordonia sp. (in: high G+C Gram-positive bacteria)]|nr:MAG: hypothetical protein DI630_27010 [Gordonia sp. (in: high G+C Gram-positive bacteria)]